MKRIVGLLIFCLGISVLPSAAVAEVYNFQIGGCKDANPNMGPYNVVECQMGARYSFRVELDVITVNSNQGGTVDVYSSWGQKWHWEFGRCSSGDFSCARMFKVHEAFTWPSLDYNTNITIVASDNIEFVNLPDEYSLMDGYDPIATP